MTVCYSCKVVQRSKKKKLIPKSTNYFLNQSTFEWLWNHVWLSKETYVFISLFTNLQFYRPHWRLGQSEKLCFWIHLRGCCQIFKKRHFKHELNCCIFIGGEEVWFNASWLWGDPMSQSPCPLAYLVMGCSGGGGQSVLDVLIKRHCCEPCVYPNALEK